MGNVLSSASTRGRTPHSVTSESETMNDSQDQDTTDEVFHEAVDQDEEQIRINNREQAMIEFKKQLDIKREQRKAILSRHRSEKEELQKKLEAEKKHSLNLSENNKLLRELLVQNNILIPEGLQPSNKNAELLSVIDQMKEEFETIRSNNLRLRQDLANSNRALQSAYSDMSELTAQNTQSIKQIRALKDLVTASKTMITLREEQLTQLKEKLSEIERSLADREASVMSSDLRQEYERQLQNIRTLRGLYEERARLAEVAKQSLVRELEQQKMLTQTEVNRSTDLTVQLKELESKIDDLEDVVKDKSNEISTIKEETRTLNAEMSVVNKLFSQVLLGYKSKKDLDTLVNRLQENHGLLTQMAEKEYDSEVSSALPKLLLEIVSQVDEIEIKDVKPHNDNPEERIANESPPIAGSSSPEEIVEKLPKVWKVLMELLSHQTLTEDSTAVKVTTCYKSVDTKSGPVLVPSVSQTYIRLKDLIIEKLSLVKEVNRIKKLNTHLATRLEEQEHRLCHVTKELSKTWHVVGRLRRHHHQLHTHEKILKYELQQKRKLLNEIKEELEYCREKWEQAREKNSQSEKDWKKLRTEFSDRKTKVNVDSLHNSGESGYSDEKPSDDSSESCDESEYLTEPLVQCKKKNKKLSENILDSSADFNLAAEREDPASDMIDVADLPLDSHEGDENQLSCTSDSCNSESYQQYDKVCESEDEVGEITNDSCIDNTFTVIQQPEAKESTIVTPDLAKILESIKEQNERLALKDKRLESLEKSGENLLTQTQNTVNLSDQLNDTLDHILQRPSCSTYNQSLKNSELIQLKQIQMTEPVKESPIQTEVITNETTSTGNFRTSVSPNRDQIDVQNKESINQVQIQNISTTYGNLIEQNQYFKQPADNINDPQPSSSCSDVSQINFKAILENIQNQNEHLAKKDKRLAQLEKDTSDVVDKISNTMSVSRDIEDKLENLHSKHREQSPVSRASIEVSNDDDVTKNDQASSRSDSESRDSEVDHEAIFAARDKRLKRLEEQTKSLVYKVNKTTSKGVKINYKLEELHNIYSSEGSRAGTPDDTRGRNQNNSDDKEEEEPEK